MRAPARKVETRQRRAGPRPLHRRRQPVRAPPVERSGRSRAQRLEALRAGPRRRSGRRIEGQAEGPQALKGRPSACLGILLLRRALRERRGVRDDLEPFHLGRARLPCPGPARRGRASARRAGARPRWRRTPPPARRRRRRCDGRAPAPPLAPRRPRPLPRATGAPHPCGARRRLPPGPAVPPPTPADPPRTPPRRTTAPRPNGTSPRQPSASRPSVEAPSPQAISAPASRARSANAPARMCIPPSTRHTPDASEWKISDSSAGERRGSPPT